MSVKGYDPVKQIKGQSGRMKIESCEKATAIVTNKKAHSSEWASIIKYIITGTELRFL